MKKKDLFTYFFTTFCLWIDNFCEGKSFYVSERGNDKSSCTKNSPCKTLNRAYILAIESKNLTKINLVLKGLYQMNHTLFVNSTSDQLSNLVISGVDNTEVVSCEESLLVIGCKESSHACINYNVSIENLAFRSTTQQTLIVVYQVPLILIRNCTFANTLGTSIEGYDTGGMIYQCSFNVGRTFSKPYRIPNNTMQSPKNGALRFTLNEASDRSIYILNSSFFNNSAVFKSHHVPAIPLDAVHDSMHYGGALQVVFMGDSSLNNVTINGCHFEANKALLGGAVSIILTNQTTSNTFRIINTKFVRNYAAVSGGGFSVKSFGRASKFSLMFRNVTFDENVAQSSGGGGKVTFENVDDDRLSLKFETTRFIKNSAQFHAALGIFQTSRASLSPKRTLVIFKDTNFIGNKLFQNCSYVHTGTLTAVLVDIKFEGTNSFANNSVTSPLYACASKVVMSGRVLFTDNKAYFAGGGISLVDGSQIIMMAGTNLTFHKNYASVRGGAIYYQSSLVDDEFNWLNPLCFVQYEASDVPAKNWTVKMVFIANGAGYKGAAVYAVSVSQCVWGPGETSSNRKRVLRWNKGFVYKDNYVGSWRENAEDRSNDDDDDDDDDTIATDTRKYVVDKPSKNEARSPGELHHLDFKAFDEYGRRVSTFATLTNSDYWPNETRVFASSIQTNNKIVFSAFNDSSMSTFTYRMSSEDAYESIQHGKSKKLHRIDVIDYNSIYGAKITVDLTPIPCRPGYRFDASQLSCACDYSIRGLTGCDGTIIRMSKGVWATVAKMNRSQLVFFDCPKSYCHCNPGGDYRSDCQFDPDRPDKQCQSRREGFLCGKCNNDSSITLPSYKCTECENIAKSITIFIFVVFFAIAVCLGILYFNPKLSEYLKGIFFYTQILPYIFTDSGSVAARVANFFCTIVNSVAIGSMPVEMCLFKGLDLIGAIGISYVIPLTCALIVTIAYVLGGCRLLNFRRDSPFNAFWVLTIVVFKLLVETSMQSVTCFRVDGELVFFFDGSVKCFSREHLALFIPSALIMVFLVIPLPIVIVLISFGRLRVPPHVSDIITSGYRNEYRWWCAFDLSRRLAYAAIYLFIPDWTVKKILFIFLSIFLCVVHSIAGPYQKKNANYGEMFLLGSLSLTAAFQAMPDSEKTSRNVASMIALVPTIMYTIVIVVYLTLKRIRKCKRGMLRRRIEGSLKDNEGNRFPIPKRVLFERPVFRSNKRESDSYEDEATERPAISDSSLGGL